MKRIIVGAAFAAVGIACSAGREHVGESEEDLTVRLSPAALPAGTFSATSYEVQCRAVQVAAFKFHVVAPELLKFGATAIELSTLERDLSGVTKSLCQADPRPQFATDAQAYEYDLGRITTRAASTLHTTKVEALAQIVSRMVSAANLDPCLKFHPLNLFDAKLFASALSTMSICVTSRRLGPVRLGTVRSADTAGNETGCTAKRMLDQGTDNGNPFQQQETTLSDGRVVTQTNTKNPAGDLIKVEQVIKNLDGSKTTVRLDATLEAMARAKPYQNVADGLLGTGATLGGLALSSTLFPEPVATKLAAIPLASLGIIYGVEGGLMKLFGLYLSLPDAYDPHTWGLDTRPCKGQDAGAGDASSDAASDGGNDGGNDSGTSPRCQNGKERFGYGCCRQQRPGNPVQCCPDEDACCKGMPEPPYGQPRPSNAEYYGAMGCYWTP